ncbi:sulfotransferase [Palleronia abyssalis]|uniref:Sulfotransferase domain-containing protein n=1 Tax=Palleronia abyssalis TaxID=1501240 RepID=A0A2R8BTI2_9RHOB|nr:sulfotransferase [Palleronia abyssalis]SPJ23487.1 hypothetical protein PAA8504_01298 [Palleronia abyssalis]
MTPGEPRLCFVTGMHRSGTTWLGHATSAITGTRLLDEPFHPNFGLRRVSDWYLDPDRLSDRDILFDGLRCLQDGTARFHRKVDLKRPLSTASVLVRGSGTERAFHAFHRAPTAFMAIKDPFLLRMTPLLLASGHRVIVSVRHPAAILRSLDRMGWRVSDRGTGDRIERMCAWWLDLYGPLLADPRVLRDQGLFVVPHETVFLDTDRLGRALAGFLGATDAGKASLDAFVSRSTRAKTVKPLHARQHDLARDSVVLSSGWRADWNMEVLSRFDRHVGASYAQFLAAGERCLDRASQSQTHHPEGSRASYPEKRDKPQAPAAQ